MSRLFLSGLLISLLVISFSQDQRPPPSKERLQSYLAADKIYRRGEQLSLRPDFDERIEELQGNLYKQALNAFSEILSRFRKENDDSLAFHCYLRIGLIQHYFDSLEPAKINYRQAILLGETIPAIEDSFLFRPYLFTGGIYYSRNEFDTALAYYKKAEGVQDKYTTALNESERLYNRLGVMYYETGNYRQAKNYFEKAIATISPADPYYSDLLVNYKINIASILIKLEEFDEANTIYETLRRYGMHTNEIAHNTGIIHQKLGNSKKALEYFRQVDYGKNKKNIDLFYNLGMAFSLLKQQDSARYYLQKALEENTYWNRNKKNVNLGLIMKFTADGKLEENEYKEAIENYQQAIIQLVNDFNDANVYINPAGFSGVFSYINLFNTLIAKADAFEKWYYQEKDTSFLGASLAAYRSAFSLASYVERTYNSDESRLFLNKIKYTVHSKPIDVSLLLFDLTGNRKYLEEAFLFDQRNKASVLSLNVQENELKSKQEGLHDLFLQESSVKAAINRQLLKASQTTDSTPLQQIKAFIREQEIQLGKLQEKMNDDPAYREKQLTERIPPVNEMQKKLDNETALLSYHLSEDKLLALFISGAKFEYTATAIGKDFFYRLDSFKTALGNVSNERHYDGAGVSEALYKTLIFPIEDKLGNIRRLIIIPDDELNYLPFEALQDEKGKYLVEKFSIQYQYSAALFEEKAANALMKGILAFAPFTSENYSDSSGFVLSSLPSSKEEVGILEGKIFIDSLATREAFLEAARHYGIIHLATHASANNEMPLRSFISFYPGKDEYRLFAEEIYSMDLDSTGLVILSACETGTGKLVHGEGLMSLSRAFAYAGCRNIITSLWKAEDKTTAFISQRLHYYLEKGFSKDKSLQQAKLDLLNSAEIDPRLKTPNYWAHLVFIGQYEPVKNSGRRWWIAAGVLILVTGGVLIFRMTTSRNPG